MKVSKSAILTAIFSFGVAVSPAMATVVNYSTSGVFSDGTILLPNVLPGTGGGALTFNGGVGCAVPFVVIGCGVSSSPDTIGLGTFVPTLPANGTITGMGSFMLTVNQTIVSGPTGSGTASGTLSGLVSGPTITSGTTGSLFLTFSNTSFLIDGVDYQLQGLQCATLTGACSAGDTRDVLAIGVTDPQGVTLQADITNATPEPAFYGLTGLGLVGLFAMAIRRKYREA